MGSEGSCRRHCKGHCHSCGKPRHWAHECCEPNEDAATGMSNILQPSGTPSTNSKNKPSGLANAVAKHSFKGEGFWTVEEEVAPMLTFGADPDLCIGDLDDIEVGP